MTKLLGMARNRRRLQKKFKNKSLTKQCFKDECDINRIVKSHLRGNIDDHVNSSKPHYGDFSNPVDYQSAMNLVIHANEQFDALSADVRKKFDNDPSKFLQFCSDENNVDEMVALGLAEKRELNVNKAPPEPQKQVDHVVESKNEQN